MDKQNSQLLEIRNQQVFLDFQKQFIRDEDLCTQFEKTNSVMKE